MSAALHAQARLRSQRGQALVLGLVLMGMAAIAFVRFFHVGQVAAARAKQTHALDAAAYSGALVQARALNLMSLINRAQVGHQMAMAHLVTLGSWAIFGGTEAQRLARGNPPAYLIAMMFGPEHGAAYVAAGLAAGFEAKSLPQGALARAFAAHDQLVHTVLVAAARQVHGSVPHAREQIMQAVLHANYKGAAAFFSGGHETPAGSFQLSIRDDAWPGYVGARQGLRLRPFVLDAALRFGFLQPRNHTQRNNWVVDLRCPTWRHELRRRGHTVLDALGQWESIDTQSFHALRSNRFIGCYYREYPMGWGWIPTLAGASLAQAHVRNPPEDFSAQDFWRWVEASTDWDLTSGSMGNPLANSYAVAQGVVWQGSGLPDYFDTAAGGPQAVGFTLVLRHPGPENLTLTTRSAAEAFYARPQARADGRVEGANVFRPYWQARLSGRILPED